MMINSHTSAQIEKEYYIQDDDGMHVDEVYTIPLLRHKIRRI